MTLPQFIQKHRAELDAAIRVRCPNIGTLNDKERRLWVLNNEYLYQWARDEGVDI